MSQLGQLPGEIRVFGAEPVAVAVTATFSRMKLTEELGGDSPMLSDWDGVVVNGYGAQYREWKGHTGVAKRSVFVIDTTRRIQYRWMTDDALEIPNLTEAVRVLESLAV